MSKPKKTKRRKPKPCGYPLADACGKHGCRCCDPVYRVWHVRSTMKSVSNWQHGEPVEWVYVVPAENVEKLTREARSAMWRMGSENGETHRAFGNGMFRVLRELGLIGGKR